MNEKVLIIWGAGKFGKTAYSYFSNLYNEIMYVDNNPQKWGKRLNGLIICNPAEIDFEGRDVVIASKYNKEDILDQLKHEKKIRSITVFSVNISNWNIYEDRKSNNDLWIKDNRCFIIHFSGGLGNQLFQYALFKNAEKNKARVFANLSKYYAAGKREFILDKVFDGITINTVTNKEEDHIIEKVIAGEYRGSFTIFHEEMGTGAIKKSDPNLLDAKGGIYDGTFQTSFWADRLRGELLEDLCFRIDAEDKLYDIAKKIENDTNAVSIHYRRGDYLDEGNKYIYGDICTDKYYASAIAYISEKTDNPHFYIFSDDIDYVKEYLRIPNSFYIDRELFDYYEDWYDMCLMTKCKYNIIANSTFSWWGAWLNKNPDRLVIAPTRWVNIYKYEDIYPKGWITIDG